jgi:hypothetical protein
LEIIMTPFEKLTDHVARYKYTKGQHKGAAPLDPTRRWKGHVRVLRTSEGNMIVRMYYTDIITVTPDNRITLNTDHWSASPTTRESVYYGLVAAGITGTWMRSRRKLGASHTTLRTPYGEYLFYNGMEIDAQGKLVSEPRPFSQTRTDKQATALLKQELIDSGFTGMFAVLYGTAPEPENNYSLDPMIYQHRANTGHPIARDMRTAITLPEYAHLWADIVQYHKYERDYDYHVGNHTWQARPRHLVWQRIMSIAKRDLKETVTTDVVKL